jgi:hypothetical protein
VSALPCLALPCPALPCPGLPACLSVCLTICTPARLPACLPDWSMARSLRRDCEESDQIWASCSDVTITA